MGIDIYEDERELEKLKIKDEKTDRELSIAQKRALIKELKRRHGVNWKEWFSKFAGGDWFRVSAELRNSVLPPSVRR